MVRCSVFSRLGAALALAAASVSPAVAQSYDFVSRQLFLPFVQVGSTVSASVLVRLDNFVVLSSAFTPVQDTSSQSPGLTYSYDDATRQLFLPSVQSGNLFYSNVLLRLDSYTLLSSAPALPLSPVVSAVCTGVNFTLPRYDAISVGMTLEQVRRLIGCNPNSNFSLADNPGVRRIRWQELGSEKDMVVFFDAATLVVLADGNPSGRFAFKSKNIL